MSVELDKALALAKVVLQNCDSGKGDYWNPMADPDAPIAVLARQLIRVTTATGIAAIETFTKPEK